MCHFRIVTFSCLCFLPDSGRWIFMGPSDMFSPLFSLPLVFSLEPNGRKQHILSCFHTSCFPSLFNHNQTIPKSFPLTRCLGEKWVLMENYSFALFYLNFKTLEQKMKITQKFETKWQMCMNRKKKKKTIPLIQKWNALETHRNSKQPLFLSQLSMNQCEASRHLNRANTLSQ